MKTGVYLYSFKFNSEEMAAFVVIDHIYWERYQSKWRINNVAYCNYFNIDGENITQQCESVQSVFDSMEYLGKL